MQKKLLTAILVFLTYSFAYSQESKDSQLFLNLKKQDSIFFERGFNQCDFDFLNQAIHKDLMFYHDKSGIQTRETFLENTRKYICSNINKKPIRKVEEKSLVVFPMYNNGVLYGAIQHGNHNFFIREKNKVDVQTGAAKFTHLYLLENGNWILREVFSYDHKEPMKSEN